MYSNGEYFSLIYAVINIGGSISVHRYTIKMPVDGQTRSVIKETELFIDEENKKFANDKHFLSSRQRVICEYVKNIEM